MKRGLYDLDVYIKLPQVLVAYHDASNPDTFFSYNLSPLCVWFLAIRLIEVDSHIKHRSYH